MGLEFANLCRERFIRSLQPSAYGRRRRNSIDSTGIWGKITCGEVASSAGEASSAAGEIASNELPSLLQMER